jgi:hypothetical protein
VAATLCLPNRVFEDPALGPLDEALVDSVHGVLQAEMGTTGIGDSP